MSLNLSSKDYERLGSANTLAACDFIEYLLDNPDQLATIPNGSHVFHRTGDPWVDEQNQILAAQAEEKGETVMWVGSPVTTSA